MTKLMLLNQGIGGLLAEVGGRTGTPPTDPAQALDVETTSLYLVSFPDSLGKNRSSGNLTT